MGVFSWCTSDTRKSIPCCMPFGGLPGTVYLLNPFGEPYKESHYEGYGVFGGRDVYDLVVEWNRDYLTPDQISPPKRSDFQPDAEGDTYYASFGKDYPLDARTYAVSSNNKAFQAGMGGYSIYGSSLDGSDPIVRLDAYMADEKGGKDGWKIERCYIKEPGAVLDYLAGNALILQQNGEDFTSLSAKQLKHYLETFRFPEHISFENEKVCATPYNPKTQASSLSNIVDAANKKEANTHPSKAFDCPELEH